MFRPYYGFERLPFAKNIPPQELFEAHGQVELGMRLDCLVKEKGLGLVSGEIGCGKSTAVRRFISTLDTNRYCIIHLSNPLLGMNGLYRDLLTALNHEPPFSRPKMVARIRASFEDLLHKQRSPLVIVDEAHLLPEPAFEQLRLLFSAHMDSQSLGTLLLVGHPELRRTLHLSIHQAFQQRLAVSYHLTPFDLRDSIDYIRHHLRWAGYPSASPLFTDDALKRIYDYTKGVPRQINRLCTRALIAGMVEDKQILEDSLIRKAITDLDEN